MNKPGRVEQLERLEAFTLSVATLRTDAGEVQAPLVDNWLQLEIAVLRPPSEAEERDFFSALRTWRDRVRRATPKAPWFLLHKAPGLKIRVQTGNNIAAIEAAADLRAVAQREWLGPVGFGSFFDQAELRQVVFRADSDAWLAAAGDALLDAASDGRRGGAEAWSNALIGLARRIWSDDWVAWEAFARLARLRIGATPVPGSRPTYDPTAMVAALPAPTDAGFDASVTLLQTLNLIFNQWALDGVMQAEVLSTIQARLRPDLLNP